MMHYPKTREEWLRLRHKHVSSTEVSALFGMSPYTTAFELAVMKKQAEPDDSEAGERAEWGLRLQKSIALGIRERYGVAVRALNGYATNGREDVRMGASFDYEIIGDYGDAVPEDTTLRELYAKHGAGVLEIKNVDSLVFRNDWMSEDGVEAPEHIELQMQHQLACCTRSWGAFGVLVGGNRLEMLTRERDDEVVQAIVAKCEKFWRDLTAGKMPPVDLPTDAAIISKLYRYAAPDTLFDAQADAKVIEIVARMADASKRKNSAELEQKTAKAELLMAIGDAEKVLLPTGYVSAKTTAPVEVAAHTREGYRNVRFYEKKVKK